jgi:hypothetical protein
MSMQSGLSVKIHQVLHGYDQGHRELASSLTLDDQSRSVMRVMSDLLTEDPPDSSASYLTGYPLKSAAKFVLAKTWTAGPSFRPGSVWTHSLVLDYSVLAILPDLLVLRQLFKEPTCDGLIQTHVYSNELTLAADMQDSSPIETGARAFAALTQLYGSSPKGRVLLSSLTPERNEMLALALWRQMWPSMRRDFAFLTQVGTIPLEVGAHYTLSFVGGASEPMEAGVRESQHFASYKDLLDDLPESGPTPLRTFLGRYVIEGKSPRSIVLPMVGVFARESRNEHSAALDQLEILLHKERLPRLMKDLVKAAISSPWELEVMCRLISSLREMDLDVDVVEQFRWIQRMSSNQFKSLFHAAWTTVEGSFGTDVCRELIRVAALEMVASVAEPDNRLVLLRVRPELAYVERFWPLDDSARAELVQAVCELASFDLDRAVSIFDTSIGPKTVSVLLQQPIPDDVLLPVCVKLLTSDGFSEAVQGVASRWIVSAPERLDAVIHLGAIDQLLRVVEQLALAKICSNTSLNDVDKWSILIFQSLGNGAPVAQFGQGVLVVGYLASLKLTDDISLRLAKAFYDPLQSLVTQGRLANQSLRYLELGVFRTGLKTPLSNAMAREVARRWPMTATGCAALEVSSNAGHLLQLVSELASLQGYECLERSLTLASMPSLANEAIKRFLAQRVKVGMDKKGKARWPWKW